MFHNTTAESGEQLRIYSEKNDSQERIVLEIFLRNSGSNLNFWDTTSKTVYEAKSPIESGDVKRCMSDLTRKGLLFKQPDFLMTLGLKGRKCHTWTLSLDAFHVLIWRNRDIESTLNQLLKK